jgi:hypothetical protein
MLLFWPAALIVLPFQMIGHFLFHHLLNHSLNAQTDDLAGHIRVSAQALPQQFLHLLANFLTWWYPIHGVSVSFLLFGLGGRIKSIIPHAASFLQNYTDITGGIRWGQTRNDGSYI